MGAIDRPLSRFVRALISDPIETLLYVPEHLSQRHEHEVAYEVDRQWEEHLHVMIGAPWPCRERPQMLAKWGLAIGDVEAAGLAVGRHTYRGYSDADLALVGAAWCAVRHLCPTTVLETGVARGMTTRMLLEALELGGRGHLWSIDLPHPFDPSLHAQTGVAVPMNRRDRWTYVRGSSRRRLSDLLAQLQSVEVFIHDSLHTARNTRYELEQVAHALVPGGLMIVDDISTHQGFSAFLDTAVGFRSMVCPSADGLGLFGVIQRVEGTPHVSAPD